MSARPERRPLAIVTALPEELQGIGALARDGLAVGASGDGPRNAERGAGALCDAVRPALLIGAGVAGGLSPRLFAGNLVASRRIVGESGEAPPPDPALLARAVAAGAAAATLVTVSRPVVAASAKAELARRVGAGDRDAAAVDMESAAWSRAASARGIPFLAVRAISDRFDEDLPLYLADCVGEDGGMARGRVVRKALVHPSSIPALWRMRRRVEAAVSILAEFLRTLLAAEAPRSRP
jgi:adenosylhomocysteine nucleosidase